MKTKEYKLANTVFDKLWPIFRSITGPGIEKSLELISGYMPLTIEKIPSNSKVFDWTVPSEWHFTRGRLWGPENNLICDTFTNNLHIVNYSEPMSATLTLEQLTPHLHSLENLPDAIPYVTSYYNKTWGFCLSDKIKKSLQEGNYKVEIISKFDANGGVPYGYTVLEGESNKEILLSSYLCHPSMANNELSGPLAIISLYNRMKKWPKRRYSYRFLLNPETIGSLCFLHNHFQHLKENLVSGLILTSLGGPCRHLYYKQSKIGDPLIDSALKSSKANMYPWLTESFSPLNGSDERQYCSPGINLPVGRISRTLALGVEYHNSLDNKEYMNINQVIKSVSQIEALLKTAEISGKPVNLSPFGEPQLGRRGLYPNVNSHNTWGTSSDDSGNRNQLNSILTILSMSDGYTYMNDIADKCGSTLEELRPIIEILEQESLIRFNGTPL